jgi:hypothetical protein
MTITAPRDEGIDARSLGAIPFGIVTVALTVAIAVLAVAKFDFNPIGFSIFLIVPIGAFAAGCLAGSGLAGGLWLMQSRPTVLSYAVALGLGLACFFGIYCGIYDRTYVDDNDEINYRGDGYHISAFVDPESGEDFNFWRYLRLDVRSRDFSIYNGGSEVQSINMSSSVGGWINWGLFGLEALGILAGCFTAVELVGKLDYCESCRRYMQAAGFVSIGPEALATVWARLRSAAPDQESLTAAAREFDRPANGQPFVRIDASRCESCKAGVLTARSYTKRNNKGRYGENASAFLRMNLASPISGPVATATTGSAYDRQPSMYDLDYDPRSRAR